MKKPRKKTRHQITRDRLRSFKRHPKRGTTMKVDGKRIGLIDLFDIEHRQHNHHVFTRRCHRFWLESNPEKPDLNEYTVEIDWEDFWRGIAEPLSGYDGGDYDLGFHDYPTWFTEAMAAAQRKAIMVDNRAKGYHRDHVNRWWNARPDILTAMSAHLALRVVAMTQVSDWECGRIANRRVKLAFSNDDDADAFLAKALVYYGEDGPGA